MRLEDWKAGEIVTIANTRGLEFFVLSGGLTIGGETLEPQSWSRLPAGTDLAVTVGPEGARIWLEDAPLMHPDVLEMPASFVRTNARSVTRLLMGERGNLAPDVGKGRFMKGRRRVGYVK